MIIVTVIYYLSTACNISLQGLLFNLFVWFVNEFILGERTQETVGGRTEGATYESAGLERFHLKEHS